MKAGGLYQIGWHNFQGIFGKIEKYLQLRVYIGL